MTEHQIKYDRTRLIKELALSLGMRLIERFTRVSSTTIRYEATVDDPHTWTAPWTVAFPLTLMPGYGMYEYACHEGNHGLRNALSGSRATERTAQITATPM